MGGTVTLNTDHWAFYDDDGDETGSTINGAIDTNPTKGDLAYDTIYHVRFEIYESTGAASRNTFGQLRYRIDTGGGFGIWLPVNATSSVVRSSGTGSQLTDGNNTTTKRLGGSWALDDTNGAQDEVDGSAGDGTADFDTTGAEYLYAFTIRSADVSEDDIIELDIVATPTPDVYNPPTAWPSYTAPGSVTHYTLTADNGVFSYTGTENDLLAGRKLVAGSDSFSITGTDVDLQVDHPLDAGSGEFTITGTDAGLIADRILPAESDSFSITGTDLVLAKGYKLPASSGTFTLTGTDIRLAADRTLAADTTSYTVTGTDVDLIYTPGSAVLDAESGTFSVTGTDADLRVDRRLDAESGSFSITGTDVGMAAGRKLDAATGTFTLTGTDVSLKADRNLDAGSAAFSITGTDVTLTYTPVGGAFVLQAGSGAYTITGTPIWLLWSGIETPALRTWVIPAENREMTIPAETRSMTISAENRNNNISEDRSYTIPAENRTLDILDT